jgi:hypothetical protein
MFLIAALARAAVCIDRGRLKSMTEDFHREFSRRLRRPKRLPLRQPLQQRVNIVTDELVQQAGVGRSDVGLADSL